MGIPLPTSAISRPLLPKFKRLREMPVHHKSRLIVLLTLAVMLWGLILHDSKQQLYCPSWPICFSANSSVPLNSVFFVYLHRFSAMILGLLALSLSFDLGKSSSRAFRASLFVAFYFLVQGAMGAFLGLYRLPTIMRAAHFLFSLWTLGSAIHLGHLIEQGLGRKAATSFPRYSADLFSLGLVGISLQMIFASLLKHTGADGGISSPMAVFSSIFGLFLSAFLLRVKRPFSSLFLFVLTCFQIYSSNSPTGIIHGLTNVLIFSLILKFRFIFTDSTRPSLFSDLLQLARPKLSALVVLTAVIGLLMADGPPEYGKILAGLFFLIFKCGLWGNLECLSGKGGGRPDGENQREGRPGREDASAKRPFSWDLSLHLSPS